jgi:biopolymer transport protein TolR
MAEERLSAAQRSKIRRLSSPRELAPDEEGGELNIVPFLDIIMNVLMFVLATVAVTFMATIDTYPPKAGTASVRPPTTPTLGLTILVVNDGFSVKARGGNEGLRLRRPQKMRCRIEGDFP